MNNNSQVDALFLGAVELELSRLVHNHPPQQIKWEHIDEFRDMLAGMCNESHDERIQGFLHGVMGEFHRKYPCNRMNDRTLNGVVSELESLVRDKSLGITHHAERLHNFCCVFSAHINGGKKGIHLTKDGLLKSETII